MKKKISTYLFLSRQFLNFSLVFQFLLVVINLTSILVTVYLTREMRIREFEDDDLVSPRTNQLMYIGLTGFMSIICLYRGITAGEFYQQLIAYIGAILCLIIILLICLLALKVVLEVGEICFLLYWEG